MTILSIHHVVAGVIYAGLLLFVISRDWQSTLNRVCALIMLCFSSWTIVKGFVHSHLVSRETALLITTLSAPAWIGIYSVVLWFTLIFTGSIKRIRKPVLLLILAVPPLGLIALQFGGVLVNDFIPATYGWRFTAGSSPWLNALFLYLIVYMLAVLVLSLLFMVRTDDLIKQRQARILFLSTLATFILGSFSDIYGTMAGIGAIPQMTDLLGLIWAAGIIYATLRYRMLDVSPLMAPDNIIQLIPDALILVDRDGLIHRVNNRCMELLDYRRDELQGQPFIFLFVSGDIDPIVSDMMDRRISVRNREVVLQTSRGERVTVNFSGTAVRDKMGRHAGFVSVATDLTDRKHAEESLRRSEQELRERNDLMTRDLQISKLIQKSLIPMETHPHPNIVVEYRYYPWTDVGGDYFSITPLKEGGIGVFIGDISNHGVSAALFLSLIRAATERVIRKFALMPAEFLKILNHDLMGNMPLSYLTAIWACFTGGTGPDNPLRFTWSNAGHPYPVLHRTTGETIELRSRGEVIGMFPEIEVGELNVSLHPGDRIYLYTDGIPESFNEKGEILGYDRFLEIIAAAGDGRGADDLNAALDGIMSRLRAFNGSRPFDDDVVLIGFEIR